MKAAKSFGFAGALCLTVFLAGNASSAPTGAQVLVSGTVHEAVFGVSFGDDGSGIAVGAGGATFVSADGGKSWKAEQSQTELSLLSVVSKGGRRIAVGQMGLILTQADGPQWKKADSGTEQRLFSVDMNAAGVALAVGSFGTVLRSDDFGSSWRLVSPDWSQYTKDGLEPHLYSVKVAADGSAILSGETGLILAASPSADAWKVLHQGDTEQQIEDATLFGVDIRKDGVGYAVGQAGTILKTEDKGKTWQALPLGGDATLLSVKSPGAGHVIVTTLHGVLSSSDEGATWQYVEPEKIGGGWFNSIALAPDGSSAFVVGQAGTIARLPI